MIRTALRPKGIIALLVDRRAPEIYRDLWIGALTQAAIEYCTGRLQRTSVKDRFGEAAFSTHRYAQRDGGYQDRQLKHIGRVVPFFSPRAPMNFLKVAKALTEPSAGNTISALKDIERQNKPHLRDVITQPGIGWRVTVTGKNKPRLKIIWPAARILNTRPKYAAEWRDLRRGGAYRAIMARAKQLVDRGMKARADAARGRVAA